MTNRRTILALSIVLFAKTNWHGVLSAQTERPTAPTPVVERRVELGVQAGIGQYTYDEIQKPGTRGMISVEACLLCGRRALVMEYSHWDNITTAGGGVGAGVTVIPADRFYARFGARLMLMSDYYVGANLSVGGGWRF
jgi:hypothetical protein